MNLTRKTSFLILFLFKELASTPVTDPVPTSQFDITKKLNDTIVEILLSIKPRIVTDFSTTVVNVEKVSFGKNSKDGEILDQFRLQKPLVWANETNISYDFLHYEPNCEILTSLKNSKFRIRYDGDYLQVEDITIGANAENNLGTRERVKHFIETVTNYNINQNTDLIRALKTTCNNQPSKSLSLKYPRFREDQQQHYYLIPSISHTDYNFKNIKIVGLTNFQSLNITQEPLVYTLAINNVRGRMTMDCVVKNITEVFNSSAELDFTIDSLAISFQPDTNSIKVAAKNYSVALTKSQVKFGELFSQIVMEIMEGAIGASIMPAMTYQGTTKPGSEAANATAEVSALVNDQDIGKLVTKQTTIGESSSTKKSTNIEKSTTEQTTTSQGSTTLRPAILVDQGTKETTISHSNERSTGKTDARTIAQSEEKLTTQMSNESTTKSTTIRKTRDSLNYDISFNNVTIELLSRNTSHPEQIQCQLLNDLKFTHKINAVILPMKTGSNNESNWINFNAKVGSTNIFVTNPNTTKNGDSCEFQIHLNQVINVRSSLCIKRNIWSKKWIQELIKIKKEIDAVLLPVAKSDIIRKIKPIVCSSLDLCSQSKNIINDVFHRFVHDVLEKSRLITGFKKYNTSLIENLSNISSVSLKT